DGLSVASPELCFLQMAKEMPFVELIELGFELCGLYSLPKTEREDTKPGTVNKGFKELKPRTDVKRLSAFLGRISGMRGQRPASRAVEYILDGSASPMETKLTMLLSLPYRLGGYNLPMPELNDNIDPSKRARRSASQSSFACDLCWPEANLVAEYDSDMFHEGPRRISKDSKRRNTLIATGLQVITITKDEVYVINEFEKLAELLAVNLGVRLRYNEYPKFSAKRLELRKALFFLQ
ncbi:MAG: endonuclease domain-containing protein, partial [Eggerthellaceae bacterium]|nr:endonuclease domain-containing protein [Eggerthellaceae bacterium]